MQIIPKHIDDEFDRHEEVRFQKLRRPVKKSLDASIHVLKEVKRLLHQNRFDQALKVLTNLPNDLIRKKRKLIKKTMKEYLDYAVKRFPGTPFIKEVLIKLNGFGIKLPEHLDLTTKEKKEISKHESRQSSHPISKN
jgi:hypothetical protein